MKLEVTATEWSAVEAIEMVEMAKNSRWSTFQGSLCIDVTWPTLALLDQQLAAGATAVSSCSQLRLN